MIAQLTLYFQNLNIALSHQLYLNIAQGVASITRKYSRHLSQLQIVALSALIAEGHWILAVDEITLVNAGVSIQSFFNKLPRQKRKEFIDLLVRFASRELCFQGAVRQKAKRLQTTLSLYQTYQKAFKMMGEKSGFHKQLNSALCGIFWLAYLQNGTYIPINNIVPTGSLKAEKTKIYRYLAWAFYTFFDTLTLGEMQTVIWGLQQQQKDCLDSQLQDYTVQIQHNFSKVWEGFSLSQLRRKLLKDNYAELFLNDYCRVFSKTHQSEPNSIKYTLFFERKEELAPRPRNSAFTSGAMIATTLNLVESELNLGMEQKPPQPKPQQQVWEIYDQEEGCMRQRFIPNPLVIFEKLVNGQLEFRNNQLQQPKLPTSSNYPDSQRKLKALKWVLDICKNHSLKPSQDMKQALKEIKNDSWEQFIKFQRGRLKQLLVQYCPSCRDVQKRSQQVIAVFLSFVAALTQNDEDKQKVSSISNLTSFIFLSLSLVLCAYRTRPTSLRDLFKEFEISSEELLMPIKWAKVQDLPVLLRAFLLQVEDQLNLH